MKISICFGLACSAVALNPSAPVLAEGRDAGRSLINHMATHADLSPSARHLSATYETAEGISTELNSASSIDQLQRDLAAGFELGTASTAPLPTTTSHGQGQSASSQEDSAAAARYISLFPVSYRGIKLAKGSDVMAISTADGRILHKRRRGIPTAVDAIEPGIAATDAVDAGLDALALRFGSQDRIEASSPKLEIWISADQRGRLAWTYYLHNASPIRPDSLKVWVAAANADQAEILNVENTVHRENAVHQQHSGKVTGDIWNETTVRPTSNEALPDVYVNRTVSGSTDRATTDLDGAFRFDSGRGNADFDATLAGPFSTIIDASEDDFETEEIEEAEVLAVVDSGDTETPVGLNFEATGELDIAQVTAFHYTNVAHRLASDFIDPDNDNVNLRELPTVVNVRDVCNAFYFNDGERFATVFFQSGVLEFEDEEENPVRFECANSAHPEVIIHEFGHAFDDAKGGILDSPYSEGFSDVLAFLETRDPCTGEEFIVELECVRNAEDVLLWPPSEEELEGAPHPIGQRYSGFVWEFIQQLIKECSEDEAFAIAKQIVLGVAQANPADIPDAVHLSFVVDDDDGDLSNGTPNSEALLAAAASRNLPTEKEMSALVYRFMRKQR